MVTGKCYQSNKKTYHQIRYQSDLICKEKGLSIIDECYETFKKNTNQKVNHGMKIINESKEHLGKVNFQFDIDRVIRQSKLG